MLSYAEMIAQCAEHIAGHDDHGYSQPNRKGWGAEALAFSDGTPYSVHRGDYDCSEMVRQCCEAAGLLPRDSYMWTGNEDGVLAAAGFSRLGFTTYDLRRGDVLWKPGHTGVYLGGGLMADAHGDERGGIAGPSEGDQTGREIEVRGVLACSWQLTYRPPDGGGDGPAPEAASEEGDPMQPTTFMFRLDTWIRDAPNGTIVQGVEYAAGDTVTIDELAYANGIVWGGYTGGSGNRRWVALGHTDRVAEA